MKQSKHRNMVKSMLEHEEQIWEKNKIKEKFGINLKKSDFPNLIISEILFIISEKWKPLKLIKGYF